MRGVMVERTEKGMETRTRYHDNETVIVASQTAAPINHTITTALNFWNSTKCGTKCIPIAVPIPPTNPYDASVSTIEGAKGKRLTDRTKRGSYDDHNDPYVACEDLDPPRKEKLNCGCDNALGYDISSNLRLFAGRILAHHDRRIRRKYCAIVASVSPNEIADKRLTLTPISSGKGIDVAFKTCLRKCR